MNILFVLYQDFASNGALHAGSLANELVKLGHDCCVAVPNNMMSASSQPSVLFRPIDFDEAHEAGFGFRNGRGPDIMHAWTPREGVRKFCERMREKHSCRLFIHMEDNEWHLLTCAFGQPFESLALLDQEELDKLIPDSLSHPRRAMDFLKAADGVTVIIDRLREILPPVRSTLELWPSADEELFRSQLTRPPVERSMMGIAKNSTVIVYTGNVHHANAHEMRSLYLSVAILNREGLPATLVRTGRDFLPFLGPDEAWARQNSIELGFVDRERLPSLLAMADVLVQPGKSDKFNDYRFPSKLPEFFSAGRPVILPDTNIARHTIHRRHAFVLADCNSISIANAIREVVSDRALYDRLSLGALEFFETRLSWSHSARKLTEFYSTSEPCRRAAHCAS